MNCHIPLDRQQEHFILGFRDSDKLNPVLAPNPDFDPTLQQEGVTCVACHLRDGKIVGVLGTTDAPHPVKMIDDPNQICMRCHVVEGNRWDTLFRLPPCGTVAEIRITSYNVCYTKLLRFIVDRAAVKCPCGTQTAAAGDVFPA